MNAQEAIRARRSVKEYTGGPVSRATMETLLELALLAPNHRMTQPLSFRVMGEAAKRAYATALAKRKAAKVDDAAAAEQVREKVIERTVAVPSMVGVVVREDENPEVREEDYATAFMALENFCIAAADTGLGTHIKTGAVMGEASLREALAVGEAERLAAIVFVGHPAEIPDRKPRVSVAEVTRWLE